MKYLNLAIAFTLACAGLGILAIPGRTASAPVSNETSDATSDQKSEQGRHIFRFDTFGDQAFWGGSLKLHQPSKEANSAVSAPELVRPLHWPSV